MLLPPVPGHLTVRPAAVARRRASLYVSAGGGGEAREWEGAPAGTAGLLALAALSLVAIACVATDALPLLRGPAPTQPAGSGTSGRGPSPVRWAAALLLLAASGGGLGFGCVLLLRESPYPFWALRAEELSATITSYRALAVTDSARDPLAFLKAHPELLPTLVHTEPHAATHPPGPACGSERPSRSASGRPGSRRLCFRCLTVPFPRSSGASDGQSGPARCWEGSGSKGSISWKSRRAPSRA